ncbi:uncharacterized protein LOC129809373 [Phlebotomus papatasi]|uniref:uncharacterized protein LOC129809373 n=1 Tax=Phlebotomus papatasi TaxID=29031 RepID=UPI00248432DE|nr:uncharacterized protein LOC129809373 [Phlebotomus papatasi]
MDLKITRTCLVGSMNRIEDYIDKLTVEEKEFLGFKGNMETQAKMVKSIRERFTAIQTSIIENQTEETSRQDEKKYAHSFYARCDHLMAAIQSIICELPGSVTDEDDSKTSLPADMMRFMTSFLNQSELRHQQQMDLLLNTLTGAASINNQNNVQLNAPAPVSKLPQKNLPTFDGKFSSWFSFKDRFTSSVINFPGISDVQRLDYLTSAVSGAAASAIKNIAITDANFQVAWNILIDKFERKNDIITDHIKTFFSMPRVTPSHPEAIHEITNIFSEHTMALDAINVTQRDPWLIEFALGRLDSESRVLWGRQIGNDVPTLDQFSKFLNQRCVDHRNSNPDPVKTNQTSTTNPRQSFNKSSNSRKSANALATAATPSNSSNCRFCQESPHGLFKCAKFLCLPAEEKFQAVKRLSLCRNCFATHMTHTCTYHKCQKCHGRHNTLLHDHYASATQDSSGTSTSKSGSLPAAKNKPSSGPASDDSGSPNVLAVSTSFENQLSDSPPKIFLATALVNVLTSNGGTVPCRLVLDGAAQVNVMTTELYSRLNLPKFPANLNISGINENRSKAKFYVQATILSRMSDTSFSFKCFVLPRIAGNIPNWDVDTSAIEMPQHVQLADPSWSVQHPVDLLLCGNPYWASWLNDSISLGTGLPLLKETVFGYVVLGEHEPVPPPEEHDSVCLSTTALNETLRRFWEIESLPADEDITDDQLAAEHHFQTTHTRNSEGRFVVQLPFRENPNALGDSRSLAIRQLLALERRFEKNPELRTLYGEVMNEQLKNGWVEPVPAGSHPSSTYYMPHQGVLKNSTTTKLRIVFNASAKTSNGVCLNNLLRVGPAVQPTLAEILLRFRRHQFALTADISRMYLQVILDPSHTDFQRFVWRPDKSQRIQEFRVTRVCFGVASSPFLATRALLQLAMDNQQSHPLASQALRTSFYVDDCLLSINTLEEGITTQLQLLEVLQGAGFNLAKWTSNHPQLTPSCATDVRGDVSIGESLSSALGLRWDPHSDCFKFICPIPLSEECKTKRQMTAAIARLFDPIGLVGPIISEAKILLQEVHRKTKGWDDEFPEELSKPWRDYVSELQHIAEITVPRWISSISNPCRIELHLFCDASLKAYGAVAYLITEDSKGNRCSRLLSSKSRVAPLKPPLTIPRLELCGAHLAGELACKLRSIYSPAATYFWCDSMVVLHWLHNTTENYKIFVGKRVKEILEMSSISQWRHVPTKVNPADLISRGATPRQLADSALWWDGPTWLTESQDSWPPKFNKNLYSFTDNTVLITNAPQRDERSSVLSMFLDRYSSLHKLKCIIVQWLRIIKRSVPEGTRHFGPISPEELEKGLKVLIRMDQGENFPGLAQLLEARKDIRRSKWKNLSSLTLFVDYDGLIRVGGRLERSDEPFQAKHPILLPKSRLTDRIIEKEHQIQLHAGPSLLLATVRQRYWPVGGRNAARKIVHRCVRCTRANPMPLTQLMGQLPPFRVKLFRPFQCTGVDYAGPLKYRPAVTRGVAQRNAGVYVGYIAVFVCMASKAIHLEFVTSLSAEAFLAAFRRFAARRGTPRHMFSDHGKNFEGAVREITRLYQQENFQQSVQEATAEQGIIWHFNPPRAPHHGGLWEACVKGVKHHLNRVSMHATLSYEEMCTTLCQIEAVLNSRPICLLSTDPNEQSYLTPGHFLTGTAGNAPPDPDMSQVPINRLSCWQLCQERAQAFGRKFRLLYLNTLQQRTKWRSNEPNINPEEVVLILDETQSGERKWVLGQVESVTLGEDGLARVLSVRTSKGRYSRSITKVARIFKEDPDLLYSNQSMDQLEHTGEHVTAQS